MPIFMGRSMAGNLTADVIQMRLPLKPEFLPVLRATVGVIAGTMEFNYDEITQLRVAVSEVFDLAIRHSTGREEDAEIGDLSVRFVTERNRLEILIEAPANYSGELDTKEDEESVALLRSLMDTVEFGNERMAVGMAKYKAVQRSE